MQAIAAEFCTSNWGARLLHIEKLQLLLVLPFGLVRQLLNAIGAAYGFSVKREDGTLRLVQS